MAANALADSLPPLPAASIDYDVLQEALRGGKSGAEAVASAIVERKTRDLIAAVRDGTRVVADLIREKDGTYTITAAGLEKPETVKTEAAARKRFNELAGNPAGEAANNPITRAQPAGGASNPTE